MHRRWNLKLMSHNTSGHKASLIVLTFVYVGCVSANFEIECVSANFEIGIAILSHF